MVAYSQEIGRFAWTAFSAARRPCFKRFRAGKPSPNHSGSSCVS